VSDLPEKKNKHAFEKRGGYPRRFRPGREG